MNNFKFKLPIAILSASAIFFPIHYSQAATSVQTDITKNTTWTTKGSPYIIVNPIQIAQKAKLSIDPGVVVQFNYGAGIEVQGSIDATDERSNKKTYFTSIADQTLNTGTSSNATPNIGDYTGIIFDEGSTGVFKSVEFRYADTALTSSNARLSVSSSNFSNGNIGVSAHGGTLALSKNKFTSNAQPVIVDFVTKFSHDSNTMTDNVYNGITLDADMRDLDYTFTSGDMPYILSSNINVTSNHTLTINPGVTILPANGNNSILGIGGKINVGYSSSGNDRDQDCDRNNASAVTVLNGVSIQGYNNASVNIQNTQIKNIIGTGVEVWNNSSLKADGLTIDAVTRDGISAFSNSTVSVSNSLISNYGSSGAGIAIFNDSTAIIKKTTLDTGTDGIMAFNHATIDGDQLTIKNNTHGGIISFGNGTYASTSIKLQNSEIATNGFGIYPINYSTLNVANNSIHGNSVGALADFDTHSLARNWWGDASGPYNAVNNPTGTGDSVSDNITIAPWLTRNTISTGCTSHCNYSDHDHEHDDDRRRYSDSERKDLVRNEKDRVRNIYMERSSRF